MTLRQRTLGRSRRSSLDNTDVGAGDRLHEIGPDHPEYGRWLVFAEDREAPRLRRDNGLALGSQTLCQAP